MSSLISALEQQEGKAEMRDYWAISSELPPFEGISFGTTYEGLLQRYEATSWGRFHAGQELRFSKNFGYGDREQMLHDLGQDTHPIDHMRLVHNNLVAFIVEQLQLGADIKVEDICVGRVAAITHEFNECEAPDLTLLCGGTVGDIPFGEKTDLHRQIQSKLQSKIFEILYSDLPSWLRQRAEAVIAHEEDSLIHTLTEVAHASTFFETAALAKIAVSQAMPGDSDTFRVRQLTRLAHEVPRNVLKKEPDLIATGLELSPLFRAHATDLLGSLALTALTSAP